MYCEHFFLIYISQHFSLQKYTQHKFKEDIFLSFIIKLDINIAKTSLNFEVYKSLLWLMKSIIFLIDAPIFCSWNIK